MLPISHELVSCVQYYIGFSKILNYEVKVNIDTVYSLNWAGTRRGKIIFYLVRIDHFFTMYTML